MQYEFAILLIWNP